LWQDVGSVQLVQGTGVTDRSSNRATTGAFVALPDK
jgi:hypothetical protein